MDARAVDPWRNGSCKLLVNEAAGLGMVWESGLSAVRPVWEPVEPTTEADRRSNACLAFSNRNSSRSGLKRRAIDQKSFGGLAKVSDRKG